MHRLTSLLFAVATSTPLFAGELDGRFQADLAGANTVLDLQQQGQVVTGRYSENGTLQLDLRGQYDGQVLNAEIVLPQTNQVIATLAATYGNDQLNAHLAARDPVSGQVLERQALFQRSPSHATGTTRTGAGTLDPALVGTWVHEDIINSGGASFASFNTVLTLHLAPDGRVEQWSRSVGGGSDWSYDSDGTLQYAGQWQTTDGILLVRPDGGTDYQPATRYRFSAPYLVTEDQGGRKIWQRR
ncbi:hypothetical protein [Pseudomonas sp. ENNP23]|uniref:hypothetical protein n=1 Tax=Pseudomonas sp. ENNP23 TaxID=1535636 RepID=UPI00084A921D|nr:hypothetical protein [Pseudomonas sp. ENNP23]OEC59782.1 hypothetical protein A9G05_09680 [Pseudomonas sp. ENNP23]